jgi:hypothetical protein
MNNFCNLGNLVSGDTITVYKAGTLNLATLYDNDGGSQINNPVTVGTNGQYNFFVANGIYDFEMEGNGFETYKVENVKIQDARKLDTNEKLIFGDDGNMKMFWDGLYRLKFQDKWDKEVLEYISLGEQYGGWRIIQKRDWDDGTWQPLLDLQQLGDGENCIRWMHGRGTGPNDFWLAGIPVQPEKMPFVIFHDLKGLAFGIEEENLNMVFCKQTGVGQSWKIDPPARTHTFYDRRLSNGLIDNSFSHEMMFVVNNSDWATYKTLCPSSLDAKCRGFIKADIGGYTDGVGNGATETLWYFDINNGTLTTGPTGTATTSGSYPWFRLLVVDGQVKIQVRSADGNDTFKGTMHVSVFAPRDWSGNLLWTLA